MTTGPLAGITVLDMSRRVAGALATLHAVDAGASVIKIEPPVGDPHRELGPKSNGESAIFQALNRGKQSVCLDYDSPDTADVLQALLATADIFVEDFQTYEDAPIDYQKAETAKPDIIYCKITPYGESGAYADYRATELELQGVTGHMWFLGEQGDPPVRVGADIAEIGAGKHAFTGIIAALLHRDLVGEGQKVSVTLAGSLMSLGSHWMADFSDPDEFAGGVSHPYEVAERGYTAADGQVVFGFFGLKESRQKAWHELCRRLGLESLLEDPWMAEHGSGYVGVGKDAQEMKPILEGAMANWTREDFVAMVNEVGGRAAPFLTYRDLYGDPLHPEPAANEVTADIAAGEDGAAFRAIVSPWAGEGGFEPSGLTPPPRLGQHTDEVLQRAGLSLDRISELKARGLIKSQVKEEGK